MTTSDFDKIIEKQLEYCAKLLVAKGDEYTPNTSDRLHAFKAAAALQNITPKLALCGMLAKHLVSVYDMCRSGEYTPDHWTEKITDSINYFLILGALIEEERNEQYSDKNS